MARQDYQERLEALREDVLYLSELVAERLRESLAALETKDAERAQEIIDGDDEINDLYLDLESDCVDLLALQQPVAGDLRLIASSFKILTDLERIGDLAVNLADYTLDAEHDVFPEVDVQRIGDVTLEMLADAMEAYAEGDAERCHAVAAADDDLDDLCATASETVVRHLIDTERDDDEDVDTLLADVSRLLLTVRDLERVGDHAVNIAARTLYMVENSDELIY
jgi:phosphate transport system protein